MRIGRNIIDIETLDVDDLTVVIAEARAIRKRKITAQDLMQRMKALISEAHAEEFDFIDIRGTKVLVAEEIELYDNK